MKNKEIITEIQRIAVKKQLGMKYVNLTACNKNQLENYLLAARAPDFLITAVFSEWRKRYENMAEEIKDFYLNSLWTRNMIFEWAFIGNK